MIKGNDGKKMRNNRTAFGKKPDRPIATKFCPVIFFSQRAPVPDSRWKRVKHGRLYERKLGVDSWVNEGEEEREASRR